MEILIQAKNIIRNSQNILILPSPESQGDSLGSALALFFTLRKLGKNANLSIDDIPERLRFLLDLKNRSGDFIIAVNTARSPVTKMRYEKEGNNLKIYLSSEKGSLSQEDVFFPKEAEETGGINQKDIPKDQIDLVVTLGADSLESLGEQFRDNTEVISRSTVLNIDNSPGNENFGEVNLVDPTSSLSEITAALIESLAETDKSLIDERTATALLTGIIWSSQNFRNPRTRPKTFEVAAKLIEKGADHQKIIHQLYKQKSVSQIKLLGRVLEKLNSNEEKQLYSASLTEKDFKDCQATSKDLGFAIEELKLNFRFLPNFLILWESHASPPVIKGIFYSPQQETAKRILENFEGVSRGNSTLFLVRENDLGSAQEKILRII